MNTNNYDELIHELSGLCGILPEYWDITGTKYVASLETKKAILRAMKMRIDTTDDVVLQINERRWRAWKTFLQPVHVLSVNNQPIAIPCYIPVREGEEKRITISWSIVSETERHLKNEKRSDQKQTLRRDREGTARTGGAHPGSSFSGGALHIAEEQWIDNERYIKVHLTGPSHLDIGYYLFTVTCRHPETIFPGGSDAIQKTSRLIITPDACYIPPELEHGKTWGLSVNLYSIQSENNWGIGDFGDLGKIAGWVAGMKGSVIGINPLHAIPNANPYGVSPYSPISRLYKNFIYLDMEKIPEVAGSHALRKTVLSRKYKEELDGLRKEPLISYDRAALLKETILRKAFEIFHEEHYAATTDRGRDFMSYLAEEGDALMHFATYTALYSHFSENGAQGKGRREGSRRPCYSWQEWPERYHDPSGKTVEAFRKAHKKEILYYQYLQWLIDRQLKDIAGRSEQLGMRIGLYYDLAVGAAGGGSDAWIYQSVMAGGADVGAPPDDLGPDGQKWGFPPMISEQLRETGYELFVQTMRKNMRYGGALRIDHALGLFRLFWVPGGMSPKEGAYVSCPSEDLLRIIALESTRNQTIVIGEDLGTIGENMRETLQRYRMLSYRLFYFERNYPDPSFLAPEKYPAMALCAVTTHDLPTLAGYWSGRDIELRKQMAKHGDEAQWQQQIQLRERDKGLILQALKSRGILPPGYPSDPAMIPQMTPELCRAVYQYLALTPCKLLLVSLDDIIGTMHQQNMPGTVDAHPNWIQKTPLALEEMMRDKRFAGLSAMLMNTMRT